MALVSGGCFAAVGLNGDAGVTSIMAESVVCTRHRRRENVEIFKYLIHCFPASCCCRSSFEDIKDEGLPSPRSSPVKRRRYARSADET